jgi:hypothetical protein
VVIRALLNDQRTQPPAARALLPLLLHAYPFVFDPDQLVGTDTRKMLDDVFADAPTDVGASITTVNRKLARATASRFQILDRFANEAVVTTAIGNALADLDLLEPWPLKFDIDGHHVDSGALAGLLETWGMPCAQMLGLHRISLFRAGVLLAAAKVFFKHNPVIIPDESGETAGKSRGAAVDTQMPSTPS